MPKAAELDELDDDEMHNRLGEYRRELLNLRFQLATSQLDNSTRVSVVRKDIARVLTLMREREIALAEAAQAAEAGEEPVVAPRPRRVRRRPAVEEEIAEPEVAAEPDGSAELSESEVVAGDVDEDVVDETDNEDVVDEIGDEELGDDVDEGVDELDEEDV